MIDALSELLDPKLGYASVQATSVLNIEANLLTIVIRPRFERRCKKSALVSACLSVNVIFVPL